MQPPINFLSFGSEGEYGLIKVNMDQSPQAHLIRAAIRDLSTELKEPCIPFGDVAYILLHRQATSDDMVALAAVDLNFSVRPDGLDPSPVVVAAMVMPSYRRQGHMHTLMRHILDTTPNISVHSPSEHMTLVMRNLRIPHARDTPCQGS